MYGDTNLLHCDVLFSRIHSVAQIMSSGISAGVLPGEYSLRETGAGGTGPRERAVKIVGSGISEVPIKNNIIII